MPINVVADLSHHNGNVELAAAKNAGLLGIIHKATQGWQYKDPMYQSNQQKAVAAGLLWGAYHFGVGADGIEQADFFLSTVQPGPNTLVVLDFEANAAGSSMDIIEARAFVTHVQQMTGRWPGLYAGQYLKELLGSVPDPVLANCWLWLAQYGPTPVLPPGWQNWTMWQYTDGAVGPEPHAVPGIGHCDRDMFNGTVAELTALWGATPLATPVPVDGRVLSLQTPYLVGDDVRAVQQALSATGFEVTADGVFGFQTDAAVRQFQQVHGLAVDGIVGPETRAALGL
jgi:GH25 family lysozyme M1 (1,4-beta-N-acetylmuramidase)